MTNITIDTAPIGGNVKLRLATALTSPSTTYQILTLIDYQHIPPYLISTHKHKISLDNEETITSEETEGTVGFIETIFKSSLATNRIISLLLSNPQSPDVFGILYPDFVSQGPHTIKLGFIDLADDYTTSLLHPDQIQQAYQEEEEEEEEEEEGYDDQQEPNKEPQSKLARSLNAHIIRRRFKSTNPSTPNASNSSSISNTPTQTSPIPSQATSLSSLSATTSSSSFTFRSDTFLSSLERLVRGEFRMRRLDSRLEQSTLRRLEKLLIRSVMFKFRNRPGVQDTREHDKNSTENAVPPVVKVKVSVVEIEEVLETLIPLLL